MAPVTLLASAARTVSGLSSEMPISNLIDGLIVQLLVTNAATEVDDTLNVYIQDSMDDGVTWNDLIAFTQVLGNGADALEFIAYVATEITPTTPMAAHKDATLSAGVRQGPIGPRIRVKYVIVDSGSDNASFTFAVNCHQVR